MAFCQHGTICFFIVLAFKTCTAISPHIGRIYPGFQTSQMEWAENNGIFLMSKNSTFSFGFYAAVEDQSYVLVIQHVYSARNVWTAHRPWVVDKYDKFVFGNDGNAYLKKGDKLIWQTSTMGEKATSMELQDSGNLVLHGSNGNILWQSFSHPTDTLLRGQEFVEGMQLRSRPDNYNRSSILEFKFGDLVLYGQYQTRQQYWSAIDEIRKTNNSIGGRVHSASLVLNSWSFYDQNKMLLGYLNFSLYTEPNITWALILGSEGAISFYNLQQGTQVSPEAFKIPQNSCSAPAFCRPYNVCYFEFCQCPEPLRVFDCNPPIPSTCSGSESSAELVRVGEKLDYVPLKYAAPHLNSTIDACKAACQKACSCTAFFFENSTGHCFLFDQIGSLKRSENGSSGYTVFAKVLQGGKSEAGSRNESMRSVFIVLIVIATILVIVGLFSVGIWYHRKQKRLQGCTEENLEEEEDFLGSFSGMPTRFSYKELTQVTKNFSTKVGQGGFGSVYLGELSDGTRLAVKKLEGIGQGKKEFRAEVKIIGSIHHMHLVKLKGFCAEGVHRLLVYEFMGKGSLDKWIFQKNESSILDWETRLSIALGTAKGLAYLHEECEWKIVHCDIKPENVLLDDNYTAKVSDFGLAKLMNREESLVYTTLRGTRGYLAPEWITNNPISEKSDVYSYGMVLLEIIGGRKSYDPGESPGKVHFPSYAFKMLEEGKIKELLDPKLDANENNESVANAIKVALWCIQDDMRLRPQMTKVVQMLEGLNGVPLPPTSPMPGSRGYSGILKWSSDEGTSSGFLDWNSNSLISDVRLSGPR